MGSKWHIYSHGTTPLQLEYEKLMWETGITVKEFEEERGLPRWSVYPEVTDPSALGFFMYDLPKDHEHRIAMLGNSGSFRQSVGVKEKPMFNGMCKYSKVGGEQKKRKFHWKDTHFTLKEGS